MTDQFVVPQFIEVEDKIFGPITVRQFVILLVTGGLVFGFFKLFDFALFLLVGVPTFAAGVILAFVRINSQPFHYFLLNLIQTWRRPKIRVWNKELGEGQLREFLTAPEAKPLPLPPQKPLLEASKLAELSLVVNTGGVYQPEEDELTR